MAEGTVKIAQIASREDFQNRIHALIMYDAYSGYNDVALSEPLKQARINVLKKLNANPALLRIVGMAILADPNVLNVINEQDGAREITDAAFLSRIRPMFPYLDLVL